MRLWSLHPKYLDAKGFVALWRESLLAKKVLEGKTAGYRHHPQLKRFKASGSVTGCINLYLSALFDESLARGYNFNRDKIGQIRSLCQLTVTEGQLNFEMSHLLGKLEKRDPERFKKLSMIESPEPHPLFRITEGEIEEWEIVD